MAKPLEVKLDLSKLVKLNPREQLIIRKRFEDKLTLREIGEIVGLCRERVREIEVKALWKLGDGKTRYNG